MTTKLPYSMCDDDLQARIDVGGSFDPTALQASIDRVAGALQYPSLVSSTLISPTQILNVWSGYVNPNIGTPDLFTVNGHAVTAHAVVSGYRTMLTLGEPAVSSETLYLSYANPSLRQYDSMRDVLTPIGVTPSFTNVPVLQSIPGGVDPEFEATVNAELETKLTELPQSTLVSGATLTRALHLNRPLIIGGSAASTQAFTNAAGSGAVAGDHYYLRNAGTGTFTATGAITAPAGYKLTAGPGEAFTADYVSSTDAWVSTTIAASAASASPTTTKGDLIVRGASADIRLPAPSTDGWILYADSTSASGLRWGAPTSGGSSPGSLTITTYTDPGSLNLDSASPAFSDWFVRGINAAASSTNPVNYARKHAVNLFTEDTIYGDISRSGSAYGAAISVTWTSGDDFSSSGIPSSGPWTSMQAYVLSNTTSQSGVSYSFPAPSGSAAASKVRVRGWNDTTAMRIVATLSDGSSAPVNVVPPSSGGQYFTYEITFKAGSAGQNLTLKFEKPTATTAVTDTGDFAINYIGLVV